jgi:hypothetical protein
MNRHRQSQPQRNPHFVLLLESSSIPREAASAQSLHYVELAIEEELDMIACKRPPN